MGVVRGPSIVTDGLVFCVDAASQRSYPGNGTVWTDLVGDNNGTLTNSPSFSVENAGSFLFDNTNDYVYNSSVSSGLLFDDPDEFTCDFWVKCYAVSGGRNSMVSIKGGPGDQNKKAGWSIGQSNGTNKYEWQVGDGTNFSLGFAYEFGTINQEWQHVAVSHTSGNVNCYVDSIFITGREAGNHALFTGVNELYLAKRDGLGEYHNGNIANVHIYNKALSSDEIRQNYLATKGRFGL
jgi:hypothetical protein